jgi:hypothetical protein
MAGVRPGTGKRLKSNRRGIEIGNRGVLNRAIGFEFSNAG